MSWAIRVCLSTYAREANTEAEHLLGASVKSIKRYSKACLPTRLPVPSLQRQRLGCSMGLEGKCHVLRFGPGWPVGHCSCLGHLNSLRNLCRGLTLSA